MATEHHPLRVLVASKETFDVKRFSIEESLSELFSVSVIATSGNPSIDFDKIIGQPASFSLRTATGDQPDRLWTGICDHAEQIQGITPGASGAKTKEQSTYYIHIVPFFWKTTQTSNHRIFQQKTVKDIVSELLKEWKLKVRWELTRNESFYRKYDYIVQYGESDHDFIRRLLQREGITHLFRFLGTKATEFILSDQPQTGKRRKRAIRAFDTPQESHGSEYLTHVRISHTVQPGVVTLRDYEFRKKYNLLTKSTSKDKVAPPENFYEQYHYAPGAFLIDMEKSPGGKTPNADDKGIFARHDTAEGEKLAQLMLESQRKYKQRVRFETNCPDLAPGVIFTMEDHPRPEMKAPLLVTRFFFEGTATGEWTGGGEASFSAVPHVPDFKTPKPKIIGMQSAIVVGPDKEKNQEIHTDEHGRVRVKFHWDRRKEADDNSSCWLRVSQDWSGIGFGSFMLPRVGQEVLVAFYEGDPDHPVVVGRVYNETNPVPYKLPKHRTRSTWKTDSSPNSTGFSELMFEDKDKHELVYLQAQKDMQKLVKNYETERTFSNRLTVVGEQRQTVVGLLDATMVGDNYLLELIEPPNKGALGIQGQTDPEINPTDTKIEVRDERIIFTTGKATVAFDGKNIRFDADGDITIRSEKKDVILEGKMMFINTIPAPAAPKPGAPVPPKQGSEDLDQLYAEAAKALVELAGATHIIARDTDGRAVIPHNVAPRTEKAQRFWYNKIIETAVKADRALEKVAEINGGNPTLSERALRASNLRHKARIDVRTMMLDSEHGALKVAKLQARDLEKYGNPDGPTFQQLIDKGLSEGKSKDQVYKDIIHSSGRTDKAYNKKAGYSS